MTVTTNDPIKILESNDLHQMGWWLYHIRKEHKYDHNNVKHFPYASRRISL